jgi:hypothetical protein
MATQRITVATIAGAAGVAVADLFCQWIVASGQGKANQPTLEQFCEGLRSNGHMLPVLFFVEWIDHWLMGDEVPGPGTVSGQRFEACCLTSSEAKQWAQQIGNQFPEKEWLKSRLRIAASTWHPSESEAVVVILREVLGPSVSAEDVEGTMDKVPEWLKL